MWKVGGATTSSGARSGGISGLIGGLAGGKIGEKLGERFGGSKSNGTEPAPLISMSHDVRRYSVEPVRDSQFVPPSNYRRTNP